MGESVKCGTHNKLLNPWLLQFQKMGLELKCPLCLDLFRRPVLLPCDHIFCRTCVENSTNSEEKLCAVCNNKFVAPDLRTLPFIENMAKIYRSLDPNPCATLIQHACSDKKKVGHRICNEIMDCKTRDFKMSCAGRVGCNNVAKPSSGGLNPEPEAEAPGKCEAVEIDMNHVAHLSPDSSPFSDAKVSCNDCGDLDSEHRLESFLMKQARKEKRDPAERLTQMSTEGSLEAEGYTTDLKRQKHYGSVEMGSIVDHAQQGCPQSNNMQDMICGPEFKSRLNTDAELPAVMDYAHSNNYICSFCQSAKVSEVTGLMLHYSNGISVTGDAASKPHVIHVHRVCVNWAPQVYFADEAVKNLRAEVARGAKLKCSKCGLKGAALGCLKNSCKRTYHVTCAMEISGCRWDLENYLLLCPAHSSVKFPNEKSRPGKLKNDSLPMPIQQVHHQTDESKKWVFCGSALSTEEKIILTKFASQVGGTVSKTWTPNVTHVIASTDERGACSRTLKVLMGILCGKWILNIDWIKAGMEAMHPVDEEPYEISFDNHGCCGGPKAGRLRALANEDLLDLVVAGGGTVLESKEEIMTKNFENEVAPSKLLVVYNLDPPNRYELGDEVSLLWQRLNEAQDLAANVGSQVVGHTWLLESIAACKLQPIVRLD